MELIKFKRQYLVTATTVPELNSWQKTSFNGLNVYVEQSLQMLKCSVGKNEYLLLGYWINPYYPEQCNADIMNDMVAECDSFEKVLKFLYPLSGRFALFCKFGDKAYGVSDAGGFRPICYTIGDGVINITSNIFLLKYVMNLKEKEEKYRFEHSDFYRWSSTYGWCPGYTFYQNVESVIANHYLDINERKIVRFYPNTFLPSINAEADVDKVTSEIAELLKNSVAGIVKRGPVSFSLTSGYDSRMILSTAKGYADKMYFWIFYYSTKQSDFFLPNRILSDVGLKRFPIKFNAKKYRKYKNFYFQNTPMAHDMWAKLNCSLIDTYPENYVNIRGAASEVLKCEQFQDGNHPDSVDINYVRNLSNFYYLNESSDDVVTQMAIYLDQMQESCKKYGYKTLDFLQWEAGNSCGQWQAQSELESDFLYEVFVPLSNRRLWDLFLSIPSKYRIRENNIEVYQRIIKGNWPELLNYPFNPPSNYSKMELKLQYYRDAAKFKLRKMFGK